MHALLKHELHPLPTVTELFSNNYSILLRSGYVSIFTGSESQCDKRAKVITEEFVGAIAPKQ